MVKVRFQPLHYMASSIAHDFFCQEANTLSSFCVLMSKGVTSPGPHTRPACNLGYCRDLFKKRRWFWPQYSVFFIDFRWCEGSGACFERLRMRSRSMRKCAHMNARDLGSILAVCACAYHPIHVTAQGKSLGPNCACVLPPRMYVPSYECVCSLPHAEILHADWSKWVTWTQVMTFQC